MIRSIHQLWLQVVLFASIMIAIVIPTVNGKLFLLPLITIVESNSATSTREPSEEKKDHHHHHHHHRRVYNIGVKQERPLAVNYDDDDDDDDNDDDESYDHDTTTTILPTTKKSPSQQQQQIRGTTSSSLTLLAAAAAKQLRQIVHSIAVPYIGWAGLYKKRWHGYLSLIGVLFAPIAALWFIIVFCSSDSSSVEGLDHNNNSSDDNDIDHRQEDWVELSKFVLIYTFCMIIICSVPMILPAIMVFDAPDSEDLILNNLLSCLLLSGPTFCIWGQLCGFMYYFQSNNNNKNVKKTQHRMILNGPLAFIATLLGFGVITWLLDIIFPKV